MFQGLNISRAVQYNASAAELARAVNDMGNWADVVLVERRDPGAWNGYQGDMFEWHLTFSPRDGDVPELQVTILTYSVHA